MTDLFDVRRQGARQNFMSDIRGRFAMKAHLVEDLCIKRQGRRDR